MRMTIKLLLCAAVLAGGVARADSLSEQQRAKRKLLAYRAARADAIRKLAERIKGLMITSETTVADFVTESDQINTALSAFLTGVREKGKPRHNDDGTCELTMEVTLETIIVNLKTIHKRYYKGSKIKAQDFEQMKVTNKVQVLEETGMGAEPEPFDEGAMVPVGSGSVDAARHLAGPAKAYWNAHVTGRGRLMAVRAARVEGMRRLAERIGGVFIDSETTVQDFVAESDFINLATGTFLRGVRETGIKYHTDELIVEVKMEVTLVDVLTSIKSWMKSTQKGGQLKIKRLEQVIVTTKKRVIAETGMGIPPERYLKDVPTETIVLMRLASNSPSWVSTSKRVVGQGALDMDAAIAQAKLMAFRAAELDARRKLAEETMGLMITSSTSVADFVTAHDEIRTAMLTFQQGAHVVRGSQKLMDDGTAEVTVEIDLEPLWETILIYQRKYRVTIR